MSESEQELEHDILDPETEGVLEGQAEHKIKADAKRARDLLETRKNAYMRVLVSGQPSKADREIVITDLRAFCRRGETTFHEDERIHVLLTGRQEVALRIDDFTVLSVDALVVKYTTGRQKE